VRGSIILSNDKIKPPSKFTGNFARKANRRNRTKDFSCYVCAKRLPIEARITTLYCKSCLKKRRAESHAEDYKKSAAKKDLIPRTKVCKMCGSAFEFLKAKNKLRDICLDCIRALDIRARNRRCIYCNEILQDPLNTVKNKNKNYRTKRMKIFCNKKHKNMAWYVLGNMSENASM